MSQVRRSPVRRARGASEDVVRRFGVFAAALDAIVEPFRVVAVFDGLPETFDEELAVRLLGVYADAVSLTAREGDGRVPVDGDEAVFAPSTATFCSLRQFMNFY